MLFTLQFEKFVERGILIQRSDGTIDVRDSEKSTDIEKAINELKKYTSEIDLDEIKESILEGKGVDYGIIGNFVYKHLQCAQSIETLYL